jgi:peptidoglycan/xylan/chitin deacetylase (PgdA/CDA1 family)
VLTEALLAAGAASYVASTVLPIRGLHDWLVGGAVFRLASPGVAPTFDDGPDPERTPALLDVLARAGAKATFFLVGKCAAAHPDLVRRIAGEGHAIGNHTFTHAWLPGLSARRIEAELARCQDVLADVTGARPRLVRPPYGQRDFRFYRIARRLGLTPVLWSLDSRDWTGASSETILRRARRAGPGDVVLLHDGDPRARGTLAALTEWLATPPPVPLQRIDLA